VAGVPNPISKSLRFNSADSAYLNRTLTTPTDGKRWTWSGWVKRGILTNGTGTVQVLFSAGSAIAFFRISQTDTLLSGWTGAANLETTQVFRDPSSWYHIMLVVDTTQATASNRVKYYVNGSQITAFATTDYPTQNSTTTINSAVAHNIGAYTSSTQYFNGYMTEINFIDGQALTPSSFGMTDPITGVWEPLKYSGTYGTNGFYLNFKDATSTTTLGLDYSGNSNTWTTNNFSVTAGVGNDSMTDVPTPWIVYNTTGDVGGVVRGNYATMNPLDSKNGTASNGNLLWTATASQSDIRGTFAIPASGKYYLECTVGSNTSASSAVSFGLATSSVALDASNAVTGLYQLYASSSGYLSLNGSNVSSSLGTWTSGDVLQIAVDADNTKMWLGKNNTWYDSSGGTTGNPSTGANATSTTSMVGLFPFSNCYQNNATWNAGQRPFAYTPPSGFLSLCTTNLPASTVLKGSEYMNAVLYTGNGSSQSITGVGFQPDFTWIKSRSGADNHNLFNAVVGLPNRLFSNLTNAENTTAGTLTSFNSDGFSVGSISDVNANAVTFVGWNWKANGAGVSNTAGSITSTVSANTTSGFSIVTYTGTGSNATVGHGLNVAPSMLIVKNRTYGGAWRVYHQSIGNTKNLRLNLTNAEATDSGIWNNTSPTTTVFSVGTDADVNRSTDGMVAYCFAAISGFSAFGSYTGNGSTDGTFVYTGFRPRFIMIKRTDTTSNWVVWDTARDTYNAGGLGLYPNLPAAEDDYRSSNPDDILSNGFKPRANYANVNASGGTYVYAAFAEVSFKYALAR
jgi:hypothetical protein